MSRRSHRIEDMLQCPPQELPRLLRTIISGYEQEQTKVLFDILDFAKDSEYGRKYHFADIASVEEFREMVPVSEYDDYRQSIERMKKGEENILFPGRADSFLVSTGTTGVPKYIPESKKGVEIKRIIGNMRTVELIRMIPELMKEGKKVLAFTNASIYEKTEAGIPAGSASGQAAAEAGMVMQKFVLPIELLSMTEISAEAMDYMTMMFSIADAGVVGLVCNNVAHFHNAMKLLDQKGLQMIEDIRHGTISAEFPEEKKELLLKNWHANPTRAEELEHIHKQGGWEIGSIWPSFQAVGCWLSSSVGRSAKEFRKLFPEKTLFLEWGYGASEGKFNIPMKANSPEGPLAVFGYFFEFLPLGEESPILLSETTAGESYELILTSYSGFYRYNIHDIVEIKESEEGWKTIEFLCKTSDRIQLGNSSLTAGELTRMIEEYEKEHHTFFRLYQGRAVEDKLYLYVECVDEVWDQESLEAFLKEKLEKEGITLAGIEKMESGYRDSLYTKVLESGKTVNSTKLPVFLHS